MTIQNLKLKPAWREAGIYLGGIALLMVVFQISADTGQSPDGGSMAPQQAPQYPVWIQDPYTSESVLAHVNEPDQSLWNATRITDYEESLKANTAPPLGILTIEKLNIQVPIYNGTDEFVLNRGAGRVKGTAKMDEAGNLAISGHRDGFFRGLKDIQVGDDIEVQTTRGVETYLVSTIDIVDKSDISALSPTTEKIMTLITCYPFYFVGHAPKRYIVTATAQNSLPE